jgi:formyltetrahydrofolate-dependent phosphoribosylglycinamide formyltransferase
MADARLVVLISGNGSNLQAIIDAAASGALPAQVVLVVSNRRDAYGLQRAEQAGIATRYFPLKPYRDAGRAREEYDRDLAQVVNAHAPDLVVLAGWMHILSPVFLNDVSSRVLNLHPALPGQYPGMDVIRHAYDASRRREIDHTGVMVHEAIPQVDAGPVIAQEEVPIYPQDTLEELEARVHETEHRLLVEAIRSVLT